MNTLNELIETALNILLQSLSRNVNSPSDLWRSLEKINNNYALRGNKIQFILKIPVEMKLKKETAPGLDGVEKETLSDPAGYITKSLTYLFKLSLKSRLTSDPCRY